MKIYIDINALHFDGNKGTDYAEKELFKHYKLKKPFELSIYEDIYDEGERDIWFNIAPLENEKETGFCSFFVKMNDAEILAKNLLTIIEINNRKRQSK